MREPVKENKLIISAHTKMNTFMTQELQHPLQQLQIRPPEQRARKAQAERGPLEPECKVGMKILNRTSRVCLTEAVLHTSPPPI